MKGRIRSEIVEDYFDENNMGIHIDVKGLFNYLKEQYLERAQLIAEKNKLKVSNEQLKSIINIAFPSLRQVMNALQDIETTKGESKTYATGLNADLFTILFTKQDTEKTYAWVIENYGDRVENLIKSCGRPLADYILTTKREYINKLIPITEKVTIYGNMLMSTPDPVILAVSLIFGLQEIINTK